MSIPIIEMKNLGPAMARMLGEVEIMCEDDLRALGAVEAYHRLKLVFGHHINAVALYAMEAALRDCHWQAIEGDDKRELRAKAGLD